MSIQHAPEKSGIKLVDLEWDRRVVGTFVDAVRGAAPWALRIGTAGAAIAAEYAGVKGVASVMPPELTVLSQMYMDAAGVGKQTAEFVLQNRAELTAGAAAVLSNVGVSWLILRNMEHRAAQDLEESYRMAQMEKMRQSTAPVDEEVIEVGNAVNPLMAGHAMRMKGSGILGELFGNADAQAREIMERTTAYLVTKGASPEQVSKWVTKTAALIPQIMDKATHVKGAQTLYGVDGKSLNIAEIAFMLQHTVATEVARGERRVPRSADRLTEGQAVTEAVMANGDRVVSDPNRRKVLAIAAKAGLGFDPQEHEGGSVVGRVIQEIEVDPQLAQRCRESREALLNLLNRNSTQ